MTASILQFPEQRPEVRSCWDCIHYLSGPTTSICLEFNEHIVSETVAARGCPGYEEIQP